MEPLDIDWVEVTTYGDRDERFLPARIECVTPGCEPTEHCRGCDRPLGDIHAGKCADIVLFKVQHVVWVTEEDCYRLELSDAV